MATFSNAIDKVVTFRNSQNDYCRGTLLKVSRRSAVFEVYNPYSIVQLSEVLQDLRLRRGEEIIYQGRAVVSVLVNTGLLLIVTVTLVEGWRDFVSVLEKRSVVAGEVQTFIKDWETTKRVRADYQVAVSEMRSFLTDLHLWLEQIDLVQETVPTRHKLNIDADLFGDIKYPLLPKIAELQQQFEAAAAGVAEDEIEAHRAYAQRDLLPLMMRAPFFFRSYTKPLGYAGDYRMVDMMILGKREGPSTYAQLVNEFYLEIGLVKAHKNRLLILEARLTELAAQAKEQGRKLNVLNVGCGPAIEVQRFIVNSPLAANCTFKLIDFNAETLAYASDCIERATKTAGRSPIIKFEQESINGLLRAAGTRNEVWPSQYDFIYCAGLFDYLSDRVCQRILRLFCRWAKPGGLVMATNVHHDNPTKLIMQHVVEWTLIHRNMAELGKLAPPEFPQKLYDDETHLNVFVEITPGG